MLNKLFSRLARQLVWVVIGLAAFAAPPAIGFAVLSESGWSWAGNFLLGFTLFSAAVGGVYGALYLSGSVSRLITDLSAVTLPAHPEQVHPDTQDWLRRTVEALALRADIPVPRIAVYRSPSANAFAAGPNKKGALIALSSGLLNRHSPESIRAIIAHEISHIQQGDVFMKTWLAGGLSILGYGLSAVVLKPLQLLAPLFGQVGLFVYSAVSSLLGFFLGFFIHLSLAVYSRHCEFRADRLGAELTRRRSMIGALNALAAEGGKERLPARYQLQAFFNPSAWIFSTHPSWRRRIRALQS